MKMITLTLADTKAKCNFVLGNANFTFYSDSDGVTRFQDGNHNNGGWTVLESVDEIVEQLRDKTIIN